MKEMGKYRCLDTVGRVVIPKGFRRMHQMHTGTELAFYVEGDTIILKVHQPECVICRKAIGASQFKERAVCSTCRSELIDQFRNRSRPIL